MDGLLYLNSLPIFDSNNNAAEVSEDGCAAANGSSKENAAEREAEAGAAAGAAASAPADTGGGSKYSLRPRTQRRQRSHEDSTEDEDASEEQQRAGEKVTKVATLRLAIRYITELTRALETVSHAPPSPPPPPSQPQPQQQQEMFSVPYTTLQTQPQLGAVGLPPVSTLILPQAAFFAADAAGCEQLLTPPPSLTPSSSLGADCVAPALDDAWPPPDLCLTPPPLLDDAFLAHR